MDEITRRRTFAIISHPDAGKTTLTEKFLLYGGAINLAGSVKGKATARHAVSDWMEIEKQRGISVTSSVLQFNYDGFCINILDTPGHQDFSEDTYRTLMAADSAVMVIDGAKGVEAQTRKLFKVCARRHIPIFTFINKMDREARDSFELVDEIERELGIPCCPVNWPIGKEGEIEEIGLEDGDLGRFVTEDEAELLREEMELLDGAAAEFDQEEVSKGRLSPVFFGMTTAPLPRMSDAGLIDPQKNDFSAFVFKIQANMNKNHRDRVAFMRIVSGHFDANMEVWHVQGKKKARLSQPQQMMADDRHVVSEAWAGDIIGVFDPGIYSIGDTVCMPGNDFRFGGIPTFAPEHFARVRQVDTMKRKQFTKGIEEIAQEGAIQVFQEFHSGMEEIIVGVVGILQLDVLRFRLESEYKVEIRMESLPYEVIRWIENPDDIDLENLTGTTDMKKVVDMRGNPLLLFAHEWSVGMTLDRNKGLRLSEFGGWEEDDD